MFDQYFSSFINVQSVADRLKKLLLDRKPRNHFERDAQAAAMQTLQRFERSGWQFRAFADLFVDRGVFGVNGDGSMSYSGDDVRRDVVSLLDSYLELFPPYDDGTTADARSPILSPDELAAQVYDMEGAAEYLGKQLNTIRWYVHQTGHLKGFMRGGIHLFARSELDALKANPPRAGRRTGTRVVTKDSGRRVVKPAK